MYFINGLYTLASGAINIFQPANPGGGVPNGTQLTAAWFNDVQGELLNPLTVAGVAPAASTPTQVLTALKRIFGGNRTLISTAGTTVLTADNAGLVVVNAAAGNVVLDLPLNSSANGTPLEFVFMRTDTSANTVTVVDAGADTDAPGGNTSLTVIAGTPLWLRGDGASVWDVVLNLNGNLFAAFGISNRLGLFTSSGSWTCPAGITQVYATLVGGGGGGGGGAGAGSAGGSGGGGAGCYYKYPVTVIPGTVYPYVIGSGGAAGTNGGASPTAGGNSTFNGLTATGGGAGANASSTGGAAGTPNATAGQGGAGAATGLTFGGNGGGHLIASGTPGGFISIASNAASYGVGGAGGSATSAGGAGKQGFLILEY